MLNRGLRLTKREDFETVYKTGKSMFSPSLVLIYKNTGQEESRIGFVVGSKFSPLAVKRNRAKRQLRAILRGFMPKIKSGFDVVLVLKKDKKAPKTEFELKELKDMTEKLLFRAGLISQ